MTLPTDWFFPLRTEDINKDEFSRQKLMQNLHYNLKEMYREVAQGINGDIGGTEAQGVQAWTPVISGTTGTNGNETYSEQVGWYLRQGLIVDVWFHVSFTGHTGTGSTVLNLPYEATESPGWPWQGTCNGGSISFGASYTQLGIQVDRTNTFRAEIIRMGSGQPLVNLTMAAAANLRGHLRYIGVGRT